LPHHFVLAKAFYSSALARAFALGVCLHLSWKAASAERMRFDPDLSLAQSDSDHTTEMDVLLSVKICPTFSWRWTAGALMGTSSAS